ncbi:four helix bundle protein [Flaviaesturariibacter flavus]|uniref:Four helix bundle protein n=1 Tax=Flaviaesturariibacter flavus TaxID=2502780 RepID=A0A4R1B6W6_9BACT|nr:four helix bundle protein [Flaviaesturariibacter flavus]TCJ12517.1 four helix bundle protein [Flaviaesturariibacter flavus]
MKSRDYDLEDRLIRFGVVIIRMAEKLPSTYAGRHLAGQLTRSGTSPALNYGEAHGAESTADFIHKMKVGLKELRETFVCQKFIRLLGWMDQRQLETTIDENNQLIAIFVTSIKTAERNNNNKKGRGNVSSSD